jgi:SRSO17 transposase
MSKNFPGEWSPWKGLAMERRFTLRKRQLLADAELKSELSKGMLHRLEAFVYPFAVSLGRREMKANAQQYIGGLLSDLERKNIESIAYRYDQDRRALQRFIGIAPWDFRPLEKELVRQVGQRLGQDDGVIVFDPSGHKKCGHESVGIQRQWIGRLGKVENCQIGVYLGYVTHLDHALVATRLYLPKEWAKDRTRRKKCGVPKEVRFQTRHELALAMLQDYGPFLPHRWITGDDEMGRSTAFRQQLRDLSEQYILAVPSNTNVRDLEAPPPPYQGHGPHPKGSFQRVDKWSDALSEDEWTRIDVRDGEKGPLVLEIVTRRVVARTEHSRQKSTEGLLVVTRYLDDNRKMKYDYHLSNAASDTPLEELARVSKAEHLVENGLKRAKSEAGLSDYETRTWSGWYHHQTLSLIATWFLICEAVRGKKIYARDYGSFDPYSTGYPSTPSLRSSQSRLGHPVHTTEKHPQRAGEVLSLQKT